jgi:hypothetical protein
VGLSLHKQAEAITLSSCKDPLKVNLFLKCKIINIRDSYGMTKFTVLLILNHVRHFELCEESRYYKSLCFLTGFFIMFLVFIPL